MEGRVLIVDDDAGVRTVLVRILKGAGYTVQEAGDAFQALDLLDLQPPDAALLDIKMPGMDGLGLLENLRQRGLDIPVVVLTGHGDEFTARDCLEAGAAAYLTKPPDRSDLLIAVRGAVAQGRLARDASAPAEPPPLLGDSPSLTRLRSEIARVAASRATVLVAGESGTGKELVARRIHHLSDRARESFIRVNCAAIPEELIESELFGHEKGSFTGAHRRQVGKFVQADGGTIFLDEIGDMSLKTQAKVLRVLQDGEVEPVGAGTPFQVDVRVIAATNKDLKVEVESGRFRDDLFYRLAVVVLRTPPLREHPEDLAQLVGHFSDAFCDEYNRRPKRWSDEVLGQMRRYRWPGNVRELKNAVERAVIMSVEGEIPLEAVRPRAAEQRQATDVRIPIGDSLEEARSKMILQTFASTGGDRSRTADILGMDEEELGERLLKLLDAEPEAVPS